MVFIGCGLGVLFGGCESVRSWGVVFVLCGCGWCRFLQLWVVFWVAFLVWGFFVGFLGCGSRLIFCHNYVGLVVCSCGCMLGLLFWVVLFGVGLVA